MVEKFLVANVRIKAEEALEYHATAPRSIEHSRFQVSDRSR